MGATCSGRAVVCWGNKMLNEEKMCSAVRQAEEHWKALHEIPEKALEEYRTTGYIRSVCADYPVEIIDIGMDTGLVCWLDAGRQDTVALRADIDALPTDHGPRHLCGHDAHASTLLGAMHYLCAVKEELPHNVLFIFQPAEEGTHGAAAMLAHGLFDKVPQRPVRLFGIHNRPEVDRGDVVVHRGPLMSEKSVFSITYKGVTGHSSTPHKCVDSIVASAALVSGIQTIVSRNTDPLEPVICTVNSLNAGNPDIAFPESALVTGYIRSYDHPTHARMEERLRRLAESIADAYECRCETVITHMVPAVYNSDEMYSIALRAAETAVGRDHITDSRPCMASEDFAVLADEVPGFFYWVGSGIPGKKCQPWHDPDFQMDEHYMETAVPVLCASILVE